MFLGLREIINCYEIQFFVISLFHDYNFIDNSMETNTNRTKIHHPYIERGLRPSQQNMEVYISAKNLQQDAIVPEMIDIDVDLPPEIPQTNPTARITTTNNPQQQNLPGQTVIESQQSTQCCKCNQLPSDEKRLYAVFFPVQFVFTFCNLYFASKNQPSDCMDKNQGTGSLVLRQWLWGIGYTELVFMTLFLLNLISYVLNLIERTIFDTFQTLLVFGYGIKVIVWASVEFDMFRLGLKDYCSSGTFAYLLSITIIHMIILLVISALIMSLCGCRISLW